MKEREPRTSRTIWEKFFLLVFSFTPIVFVFVVQVKWIVNLLVYPLYLLFMAGGYWAGSRWHKMMRLDNDSSLDPENDPRPNTRFDRLALISAILIGLCTMVLLRSLFSHGMVRALDNITTSDDDN